MKHITYFNAGAGSGKTYKLTSLLAEKITSGIAPSEVILTTFSELAAAEFKEKAREALLDAKPDKAIELDSGSIGTVHAVAMDMVKKYWYLLDISPQVNVMSDMDKKFYISQSMMALLTPAQFDFFNDYYNEFNLEDLDFWLDDIVQIVNAIANYQIDKVAYEESKKKAQANVDVFFYTKVLPDKKTIKSIFDEMMIICNRPGTPKTILDNTLPALKKITPNNYLAYNTIYTLYKVALPGGKKGVEELNLILKMDYQEYLKECLTSTYYGEKIKQCIKYIFDIAENWVGKYKKFKTENAIIDYNDMEQLFLKLLKNKTFCDEISQRYKIVMVDEFQDSNPAQLKIFDKLSELNDEMESIWVGDPKQAIYGFRGADTDLIQSVSDEIIGDKSGRDLKHDKLPESWRTRPELVLLANNVFSRSLSGMLPEEMITLKPHWEENKDLDYPLQHWHCSGNKEASCRIIANKIKELLGSGIRVGVKNKYPQTRELEPKDIALLTFENEDRKAYINELRKLNVPVSSPENDIFRRVEVQLVCSILNYILNPYSRHTIACLRRLWNDTSVETILNESLDSAEVKGKEKKDDPKDKKEIPEDLVQIHNIVERLKDQPIADMVASIIAELNLVEFVKKWGEGQTRIQNLYTLENIAKQYDDHCLQLGLGATIGGFLQYLKTIEIDAPTDNTSNTVKVLTYHKSKGLEWPVVILTSLDRDEMSIKRLISRQYMNVNAYPLDSTASIYKRKYRIHFFPDVPAFYGAKEVTKFLFEQPMAEEIKKAEDKGKVHFFLTLQKKVQAELKRLLYVGFTRARDYLVTTSHTSYGKLAPLVWLHNADITTNGVFSVDKDKTNVWSDNREEKLQLLAKCVKVKSPETADVMSPKYIPKDFPKYAPENRRKKFVSPSSLPLVEGLAKKPELCYESKFRIVLCKSEGEDFADVGTCIHNALASFVVGDDDNNKLKAQRIVSGCGFVKQIVSSEHIVTAFNNLLTFIREQKDIYGELLEIAQEVPFYHKQANGQIVQGEMDLVCKMEKGVVLVDYKSFPGKISEFLNESGDHYVGKYAPQLAAYRNALEAAGKTVLDNLIYYVVQGCIVRL